MTLDPVVIAEDVRGLDAQANEARMTYATPQVRDCGCPQGEACRCGPRLRIFDPMGRLLMAPVYY